MSMEDIPPLDGWVTLYAAGRRLRCSKQSLHKEIDRGRFPGVRRVGGEEGRRPVYILPEHEVAARERLMPVWGSATT